MTEQEQNTPLIIGRTRAVLDLISDPRLTQHVLNYTVDHRGWERPAIQLFGDRSAKIRCLVTAVELLDEPVVSVIQFDDHVQIGVRGDYHGVTLVASVVMWQAEVVAVTRSVPAESLISALVAKFPAEAELVVSGSVA